MALLFFGLRTVFSVVSSWVSDTTGTEISGILGLRGGGEGPDSDFIRTDESLCINSVRTAGCGCRTELGAGSWTYRNKGNKHSNSSYTGEPLTEPRHYEHG